MAGHSKWAKVKHQKAVTDVVKGRIFTKLANAIIVAVREGGGGDPESNFRLRLAIEKARAANMPKEKIESAIERGSGGSGSSQFETKLYEAFGPGGVGIIIESTTDNRQRTVAELKNILDKNGGVLASSGAVMHMFSFVGYIQIPKKGLNSNDIFDAAVNAGAEDFSEGGEDIEIFTAHGDLHKVKHQLSALNVPIGMCELTYRPTLHVSITDQSQAKALLKLLHLLEDAEDTQHIYANYDMSDEYFAMEAGI